MHAIDKPVMWTITGKAVNFNPDYFDDIDIEDIAHSLANQSRFGGHTKRFYSVAEHSVNVSRYLDTPILRFKGLLHDAGECYITDIPTPIKHLSPHIVAAEEIFQAKIAKHFEYDNSNSPEIKIADAFMLAREAAELTRIPADLIAKFRQFRMPKGLDAQALDEWFQTGPRRGINVTGLNPEDARKLFLQEFERVSTLYRGLSVK